MKIYILLIFSLLNLTVTSQNLDLENKDSVLLVNIFLICKLQLQVLLLLKNGTELNFMLKVSTTMPKFVLRC